MECGLGADLLYTGVSLFCLLICYFMVTCTSTLSAFQSTLDSLSLSLSYCIVCAADMPIIFLVCTCLGYIGDICYVHPNHKPHITGIFGGDVCAVNNTRRCSEVQMFVESFVINPRFSCKVMVGDVVFFNTTFFGLCNFDLTSVGIKHTILNLIEIGCLS